MIVLLFLVLLLPIFMKIDVFMEDLIPVTLVIFGMAINAHTIPAHVLLVHHGISSLVSLQESVTMDIIWDQEDHAKYFLSNALHLQPGQVILVELLVEFVQVEPITMNKASVCLMYLARMVTYGILHI